MLPICSACSTMWAVLRPLAPIRLLKGKTASMHGDKDVVLLSHPFAGMSCTLVRLDRQPTLRQHSKKSCSSKRTQSHLISNTYRSAQFFASGLPNRMLPTKQPNHSRSAICSTLNFWS